MQRLSPLGCLPHPVGPHQILKLMLVLRGLGLQLSALGDAPRSGSVELWLRYRQRPPLQAQPTPPPARSWFLVIASRIHASPPRSFASWGCCQGDEPRPPACIASAPLLLLGPGALVLGDTISFSIYSTSPCPLAPRQLLQADCLVRLSWPL